MNPAVFLQRCDRIITGYGFKQSIPINLGECRNYINGADIGVDDDLSSMTMLDTGSKAMVLWTDDDQTWICLFNFIIPQDYDETIDKLRIRALCSKDGNTTDTIYLDAEVYRKRAGIALTADLNPTADTTAIPAAIASAAWSEINSDGEGMQGGDCLTVVLKTGAHTTDGLLIYGIEIVYAADFVYFDQTDRPL